jgi:hypothetical protein
VNIKEWRRYMKGLRHSRALSIKASSKEAVSYVWNPEVIRGILDVRLDSARVESADVVELYHTLVPLVQRELQYARMRIDEVVLSTVHEYAHKYKEANDE